MKQSLYEKIAAIMAEVTHIGKDTNVSFKDVSYKALTEVHALDLIRPFLVKYKILLIPTSIAHLSVTGKVTTLGMNYQVVDAESGESFSLASVGQGADTQDKGAGKAFTYTNKYAIVKLLQLPMKGDDPDLRSSEEMDEEKEEVFVICDELKTMISNSGLLPELKEKYLRTVGDIRESEDLGRARAAKPVVQNLIKHLPEKKKEEEDEDDGREEIDLRPDQQD